MSRATMSVLGLYRNNPKLFDDMSLPAAMSIDTLRDNLLAELAELEVLYADADFMQYMVKAWSAKQLPIWEKLYKTTVLEYDPISNYDRKEEWDENSSRNGSSYSHFGGKTTAKNDSTEENKVSAYNEASYTPHDKNVHNEEAEQENSSDTNATSSDTGTNKRTGRAYGNIGVTTTQQMIEEERESALYNIYDVIILDFKRRFCLQVY